MTDNEKTRERDFGSLSEVGKKRVGNFRKKRYKKIKDSLRKGRDTSKFEFH